MRITGCVVGCVRFVLFGYDVIAEVTGGETCALPVLFRKPYARVRQPGRRRHMINPGSPEKALTIDRKRGV